MVAEGDVVLALSQDGANSEFQIPRKFYEYYGLGKPILVVGGACQTVREILQPRDEEGLVLVEKPLPAELAAAIGRLVNAWEGGILRLQTAGNRPDRAADGGGAGDDSPRGCVGIQRVDLAWSRDSTDTK